MELFPEHKSYRTPFLALAIAGLVLRLSTVAWFHPPLFSDDIDYVALGKSLATGTGYQLEGKPTAYRPPGYPLFLALMFKMFGDSFVPVRIAQVVADLVCCLLVFVLGRRLFAERVGVIAAGIFALFPAQILYVSHMMTETIFTTLFLIFLWLCINDEHSGPKNFFAGIVLGIATLVRPTALLLLVVVFFIRWSNRFRLSENIRLLGVMSLTTFLMLSPWLVRNYEQFHRLTITSNTGVNFWMGNHSGASGSYSFPKENNPLRSVEDEFERSDLGLQLGKRFIIEHPVEWGFVLVKKWAHFFSVDYWLLLGLQFQPDYAEVPSAAVAFSRFSPVNVLAIHIPFVAILLLATFGFVCFPPQEGSKLLLLQWACIYWIIVHLVFYSGARYRFPMVPLLMIAGAYGLEILLKKSYRWTRGRAAVFFLLAALFVAGWVAEYVLIHAKANRLHPVTYSGRYRIPTHENMQACIDCGVERQRSN